MLDSRRLINLSLLAKRVKLTRGNLVLDCPVPTRYLQSVPIKDTKEFTHMRYTGEQEAKEGFAKQKH